jgi:hypothetical protein
MTSIAGQTILSPISNADFRPLEPGRGEPGPDAYIVWVWDLQPIKLNEPGLRLSVRSTEAVTDP